MSKKINQWLALIDDRDRGLIEMAEKKNVVIKRAKKEMNYLTGDEEIKRLAELREKWKIEYDLCMNYERNEGISQGLTQGRIQGEKSKAKEIAKNMLKLNMPIEQIMEITKLTREEIEVIQEEK